MRFTFKKPLVNGCEFPKETVDGDEDQGLAGSGGEAESLVSVEAG